MFFKIVYFFSGQIQIINYVKVIYNFSKHNLTEVEKSVLCKGLQFALPPRNLEYADYMVSFELLFRHIKILMSKKGKRPSFSFSIQVYHQHTVYRRQASNYEGHLFLKLHIKILARAELNGDHTINLFIEFAVKDKKRFFGGQGGQITKNSLRGLRVILIIFIQTIHANISSLYKLSMQISIVSSSGMLVNKESTSRIAMFKLGSCVKIYSAK